MSKTKIYANAIFCSRADTLENWTRENPVLLAGEHAVVTDGVCGHREKVGDGITPFCDLAWSHGLPCGEPTDTGGERFNDYQNNIAGGKGFVISDKNPNAKTYTLEGYTGGYEVGDTFSVILNSNHDMLGTITAIDGNVITVDNYTDGSGSFSALPSEDRMFWVHTKSTVGNVALSNFQHAEGRNTKALQNGAHAEGRETIASGKYSHAEGRDTVSSYCAHAEGNRTTALGQCSHAEGNGSTAGREYSHAEGYYSKTLGFAAHAQNRECLASGEYSHAGGYKAQALGPYTIAHGNEVVAKSGLQTVFGSHNADDNDALFIVGNGSAAAKSNAFAVCYDGSAKVAKMGSGDTAVATKGYVDNKDKFELISDNRYSYPSGITIINVSQDKNKKSFNLKRAKVFIDLKVSSDKTNELRIYDSQINLARFPQITLKSGQINGFVFDIDMMGNSTDGFLVTTRYPAEAMVDSSDFGFDFSQSANNHTLTSYSSFPKAIDSIAVQFKGSNIIGARIMIWGVRE